MLNRFFGQFVFDSRGRFAELRSQRVALVFNRASHSLQRVGQRTQGIARALAVFHGPADQGHGLDLGLLRLVGPLANAGQECLSLLAELVGPDLEACRIVRRKIGTALKSFRFRAEQFQLGGQGIFRLGHRFRRSLNGNGHRRNRGSGQRHVAWRELCLA